MTVSVCRIAFVALALGLSIASDSTAEVTLLAVGDLNESHAGDNAVPDRGPNAMPFDSAIDDTATYINRLHAITMGLVPNQTGTGLPYRLTLRLQATTLLWSHDQFVYGTGSGLGVPSGVPPINNVVLHFLPDAPKTSMPARTQAIRPTHGWTLKAFAFPTTD